MKSLFCAISVNWDYANARNFSSLLQSQCQQRRITAASSGQCLKSFLTVMGRKNDSVNSIYCSNVWVLTAYTPLAGALVGNTGGKEPPLPFSGLSLAENVTDISAVPGTWAQLQILTVGFRFSLCGLGQQSLGITPASIEGTVVAWCYSLSIFVPQVQESFFFWKSWGTLISAPLSLPFKML